MQKLCRKDLQLLSPDEIRELKNLILKDKGQRESALDELMSFTQIINVTFLSGFSSFFLIDEDCLCKSLIENKENLFLLSDLVNVNNFNLGESFALIESERSPKGYLSLRVERWNEDMNILQANEFNSWNSNKGKIILTVGNDDFYNDVIINLILNKVLKGFGHTFQYYTFFCGDKGYRVMEIFNQTLSEYLENDVNIDDIVKQLLLPLSVLKSERYGFIHGNLTTENILVNIDNKHNPFKMANFEQSSIYWNGIRFYNLGNYKPKNIPPPKDFYTLDFINYNHNSFGFYSSLDIYILFYSILLQPEVWNKVYPIYYEKKKTPFLKAWKSLWTEEDFNVVMSDLQYHNLFLATLREKEDVRIHLKLLRNINTIIKNFSEKKYKLKYDVNKVYLIMGIEPSISVPKEKEDLLITKHDKLAVEPNIINKTLRGDWVHTNLYSKMGVIYDWDFL